MAKLLLAIFLGGTGIVQLIEKRFGAFLRVLIAWIAQVVCAMMVFVLIDKYHINLEAVEDASDLDSEFMK